MPPHNVISLSLCTKYESKTLNSHLIYYIDVFRWKKHSGVNERNLR